MDVISGFGDKLQLMTPNPPVLRRTVNMESIETPSVPLTRAMSENVNITEPAPPWIPAPSNYVPYFSLGAPSHPLAIVPCAIWCLKKKGGPPQEYGDIQKKLCRCFLVVFFRLRIRDCRGDAPLLLEGAYHIRNWCTFCTVE